MPEDQVKIKKESSGSGLTCCSDGSHYPFGTSLNFDDDMVDELGLTGAAVGDVVEIRGFAFVDSKHESSNTDGSSKSVRLQMTSMKINRVVDDQAIQLYGDSK